MTDQTLTDAVREIAKKMHHHANQNNVRGSEEEYVRFFARQLDELLPPPPRPTLADMTDEERAACQWMQADVEQQGRAVILLPYGTGGRAVMLDQWGDVTREDHADVTPRPDLPRMEWPATGQEADQ